MTSARNSETASKTARRYLHKFGSNSRSHSTRKLVLPRWRGKRRPCSQGSGVFRESVPWMQKNGRFVFRAHSSSCLLVRATPLTSKKESVKNATRGTVSIFTGPQRNRRNLTTGYCSEN